MNLRSSILVMVFLSMALGLSAQSPQQWKKHGDAAMQEGDFTGAVYYYQKSASADSSNLDIWMVYASALRLNNYYQQAATAYQYIYEDPYRNKYDESLYYWAKMLQNLGQYEEAAHNFKTFENYHSEKGSFYQVDAHQQYTSCVWAIKHEADTVIAEINNLGVNINSGLAEFAATLMNDTTLIFSSLQYQSADSSDEVQELDIDSKIQLYEARWRTNQWEVIGPLDSIINSPSRHTANAFYYKPWKWLLYSSCDGYQNCKIMYNEWDEDGWLEAEELSGNINLEGFNNTQPYMTDVKGKPTLFFSSNRPQGQGKLDIWYAQYNKRLNGFTYPRNMGRRVNSKGNEITPFYVADSNRLYFSSDWHQGFGGFDIYSSYAASLRSSQSPSNLGQVINSSANDLYYRTYPIDSLAFLTSNRGGGTQIKSETCCNDLYFLRHEPPVVIDTLIDTAEIIPVIETVEELNAYLPVLYFHNDQPNPRSWKKTTKKTYFECYNDYRKMKIHYLNEYTTHREGSDKDSAVARMDQFFTSKIEKGIQEFDLFMDLLFTQLEKGESVLITIKGYASPLAKSDYNINLTQRRIQSLINYLYVYKNGELKPYLDGNASNGAKIEFEKIPYGDSQASTSTSDDLNDRINSVYSPSAMEERRIEILHVSSK